MQRRASIAVLGFVYPQMERFAADYFRSLDRQTDKEFDLVIVNNGLRDLARFVRPYPSLYVREIPADLSIPKLREMAIRYLRNEGYTYAIFTDTDDYFSPNRVAVSRALFAGHDVVVNDLTTVSEAGRQLMPAYLSARIKDGSTISAHFILDKNVCGFSNTAVALAAVKEDVVFADDLIAVDWYFYAGLLAAGARAVFTAAATTFYRMHKNNAVGLSSDVQQERLLRSVQAKEVHYRRLAERYDGIYKKLFDQFQALHENLADPAYRAAYYAAVKAAVTTNSLWWEEARLQEDHA